MPCPNFSRDSGECLLLADAPEDEEEPGEVRLEEPVNREWCMSPGKAYRNCPIFREFLNELVS